MESGSCVIIHLHTPKEQYWGILNIISPMGATISAININSFEDWARQVGGGKEQTMALITTFFPMHRVDRIFLDEEVGAIPSFASRFHRLSGITVEDYLGNPDDPNN